MTKRKSKKYSGEFKQKVVEEMRENGLSIREVGEKYDVVKSVVHKWERIYLEEGVACLYEERRGRGIGKRKGRPRKLEKEVEEDLIAENQRLRMENDYLKKLHALVQSEKQVSNKKHR